MKAAIRRPAQVESTGGSTGSKTKIVLRRKGSADGT